MESGGITLPNGQQIKQIDKENGYKYLGILEADKMKDTEMKECTTREPLRREINLMKVKMNVGNVILALNSSTVLVIWYETVVVPWRKDKLEEIDGKTRKFLTMYRAFDQKRAVD